MAPARDMPDVPAGSTGRLRSRSTSARKLSEPNVTIGGLTGAEVVAEAEEQQGKNGREDGRKHATVRHSYSKFGS